jgi:hypothetical protein
MWKEGLLFVEDVESFWKAFKGNGYKVEPKKMWRIRRIRIMWRIVFNLYMDVLYGNLRIFEDCAGNFRGPSALDGERDEAVSLPYWYGHRIYFHVDQFFEDQLYV